MIFLTAILVIAAFVIGVLVGRILKMSFGCPSQDNQAQATAEVKSSVLSAEAGASGDSVSTASSANFVSSNSNFDSDTKAATASEGSETKTKVEEAALPEAQVAGNVKKSPAPKTRAKSAKTKAPVKTAAKTSSVAKKSAPTPKAKSKPASAKVVAASNNAADDLKLIKGVGKLNEARLNEEGITSFAQVAAWKKADIAEFDDKLNFKGRIERDQWVPQAKVLAKGTSTKAAATKKASIKTAPVAKSTAAKKAPAKKVTSKPAAKKATPKAVKKPSTPDDLKLIKGVGKLIETKLAKEGITTYSQIAAWKKADVVEFDEKLSFKGRIDRDEWIKQAKVLAKGGTTEFSKRAAKGNVPSSS